MSLGSSLWFPKHCWRIGLFSWKDSSRRIRLCRISIESLIQFAYGRMISSFRRHPEEIASSVNECEKFLLPSWVLELPVRCCFECIKRHCQEIKCSELFLQGFCFPSERCKCAWWGETKDWGWELLAVFTELYLEQESYSFIALTIAS